jgi:hypothetical protein
MNEDDDLELLLGSRFAGLRDAEKYAETMERIATAEGEIAKSSRGNSRSSMTYAGPNARLAAANAALSQARSQGVTGGALEDLQFRQRNASRAVDRMRQGPTDPAYQALYSTRFGMGGAAPLVGRTMDAVLGPTMTRSILGAASKALGPAVAVAGVIFEGAKAIYSLTSASMAATNSLMGLRVATGGSTLDAARVQVMGGAIGASGQGARAFQDRITGTDEGRSAAAQIGMSNTRAPYGKMNFGAQYMDAIQRTAAITDENQRQRLAYMLGIEEEVARYSKLSASSRRALERTAEATRGINDPQQARDAAEFQANTTRMAQGWENLKTASGKGFAQPVMALQEAVAEFLDEMAFWADVLAKINQFSGMNIASNLLKKGLQFAQDNRLIGPGAGSGGGGQAQSATQQNTQATVALTSAIDKLAGNIGGGAGAKETLGNMQKGPFLHEMLTKRAIRAGALG